MTQKVGQDQLHDIVYRLFPVSWSEHLQVEETTSGYAQLVTKFKQIDTRPNQIIRGELFLKLDVENRAVSFPRSLIIHYDMT